MSRTGDRIRFSVTGTPGTGSFVANAAPSTYLLPSQSVPPIADQDLVSYVAIDGSNWETGRGIWTASTSTLTRGVVESSNANALVNFSSAAIITLTFLSGDLVQSQKVTAVGGETLLTVSNIPPGGSALEIELMGRTTLAATAAQIGFQVNGLTTAIYSVQRVFWNTNLNSSGTDNQLTVTPAVLVSSGGFFGIAGASCVTGTFSLLKMTFPQYANTGMNKQYEGIGRQNTNSGTGAAAAYLIPMCGQIELLAAINSVSITLGGVNAFAAGSTLVARVLP